MRRLKGKRYWLVGASEGLGRSLAVKLARAGAEVIVSARSADRLADLVAELGAPARAVAVDVSDRASVEAAAAEVGDIDGVVYLAGVYWPQSAPKWNAAQVEAMCDINFTG
ncbi:MAG: SDR family oxidoreductase, partial [Rhodobacteraceae bacterium]|nr:SDR family oxidoreductase [Paracoccaceae bacterium]